jgi:hypothetical protein
LTATSLQSAPAVAPQCKVQYKKIAPIRGGGGGNNNQPHDISNLKQNKTTSDNRTDQFPSLTVWLRVSAEKRSKRRKRQEEEEEQRGHSLRGGRTRL